MADLEWGGGKGGKLNCTGLGGWQLNTRHTHALFTSFPLATTWCKVAIGSYFISPREAPPPPSHGGGTIALSNAKQLQVAPLHLSKWLWSPLWLGEGRHHFQELIAVMQWCHCSYIWGKGWLIRELKPPGLPLSFGLLFFVLLSSFPDIYLHFSEVLLVLLDASWMGSLDSAKCSHFVESVSTPWIPWNCIGRGPSAFCHQDVIRLTRGMIHIY